MPGCRTRWQQHRWGPIEAARCLRPTHVLCMPHAANNQQLFHILHKPYMQMQHMRSDIYGVHT
jgi:hypothetical protein